jgi:hypothetical protein
MRRHMTRAHRRARVEAAARVVALWRARRCMIGARRPGTTGPPASPRAAPPLRAARTRRSVAAARSPHPDRWPADRRMAQGRRMIGGVESTSYVGGPARVVLCEAPDPVVYCRGTGAATWRRHPPSQTRCRRQGMSRTHRCDCGRSRRGRPRAGLTAGGGRGRGTWPPSCQASWRITLVVVAPETSAQTGHAALMAAGHRGNTGDVETLLRSRPPTSQVLDSASTETEAAWQMCDEE